MEHIIVAFASKQKARKFSEVLTDAGLPVFAVCTSVAEVLRSVSGLDGGVIVAGFKLADGVAQDIYDDMPLGFSLLLAASFDEKSLLPKNDIFILPSPITPATLTASVQMLMQFNRIRPKPRRKSEDEKTLVEEAKRILMERHFLTEESAHKFLQKKSMTSGQKIGECARVIINAM